MLKSSRTFRYGPILVGFFLTFGMLPAHAESDFERGYRKGYGEGFQEGMNAARAGSMNRQGAGPPGIVIIGARYGDDRKSCDLTAWAANRFNRRTGGEVEVSNELCGDPAPGSRKSLRVEFLCNGQARNAEAYEHRRLSLACF